MKTKLLFLINDLGSGGAEKVLVNLVNHLDKRKYDITVRTVMNRGVNRQFLNPEVKYDSVFKIPFRGINYLYNLPKKFIYNKITKGDFDIIIVYLHGILTKIVSHAPSTQKTINYLHFDMERTNFLKTFPNHEKMISTMKSYNAIVAVSKSVKTSFIKMTGIKENLHVIYNTYDIKKIQQLAQEDIKDYELDKKAIKICGIGSLNKRKAFDRTIRSLGKIKKENPNLNFQFFILGQGEELSLLKELIKKFNLENQVFLCGYQTNPYKFLKNSNLFVSSSIGEGFATVVVESVILGTPVLTTRTSGMEEILGSNNEYGIVVENDEQSLHEKLRFLLNNPNQINVYKEKIKKRKSFFSMEKSVSDVENLIDKVLAHD